MNTIDLTQYELAALELLIEEGLRHVLKEGLEDEYVRWLKSPQPFLKFLQRDMEKAALESLVITSRPYIGGYN